jgi:hypothetical protein
VLVVSVNVGMYNDWVRLNTVKSYYLPSVFVP